MGRSRISFVAAMDKNRLIGGDGAIPWRLPADMKRFRELTWGKPVILGRRTYNSIPAKFRPLPGRHTIVVTNQQDYAAPGATVVHSLAEALAAAGDVPEIMIGGGAVLYTALLPAADCLYLTLVDGEFSGDTYFPAWDTAVWRECAREEHPTDERHAYAYTFLTLERIRP